MKRQKRRLFPLLCCIALLLSVILLPARADSGPKPSVVVDILGLKGRTCYATLLSEQTSTGPYSSVWKEDTSGARVRNPSIGYYCGPFDPDYSIFQAFLAYEEEDPEGLYFLQFFQDCSQTSQLRWGYYPPQTFKLLLYFPETDSFLLGDAFLERYAFDSYYTVDLSGIEAEPGRTVSVLSAERSYDYTRELISLAARILLTVAVELLAAWIFKLRENRQLLVILAVNLATQIGLNVGLNWYAYCNGTAFLILPYLLMEACVTLVEFLAYFFCLPGLDPRKKAGCVGGYALAANLCSLVTGWVLALAIPGLF